MVKYISIISIIVTCCLKNRITSIKKYSFWIYSRSWYLPTAQDNTVAMTLHGGSNIQYVQIFYCNAIAVIAILSINGQAEAAQKCFNRNC